MGTTTTTLTADHVCGEDFCPRGLPYGDDLATVSVVIRQGQLRQGPSWHVNLEQAWEDACHTVGWQGPDRKRAEVELACDDGWTHTASLTPSQARRLPPCPQPEPEPEVEVDYTAFEVRVFNSVTGSLAARNYSATEQGGWNMGRSIAGEYANDTGQPHYVEVEGKQDSEPEPPSAYERSRRLMAAHRQVPRQQHRQSRGF